MLTTLFDSLQVGELLLPNRIFMAPLTRSRAGTVRVPNDLMVKYYEQRASAGLILTEATVVTAQGIGYADTPGIWSEEQVQGWRKVTDAVHRAGGRIFSQLWHVGRVSHPIFLNGELPVAPSPIAPAGFVSLVRPKTEYVVPRPLERDEIARRYRGVPSRCPERAEGGLRWRGTAWRERLPDRPVPAGPYESPDR